MMKLNVTMRKTTTRVLYTAAAVLSVVMAARVMTKSVKWFSDFRTYYYASVAHTRGFDPYNKRLLEKVSHRQVKVHPFVYPPHVLYLFKPFNRVALDAATLTYNVTKLSAFAALVFLWIALLGIGADYSIFVLFCMLAFGKTFHIDLYTGNISTFEQLLIWCGVWFFLKRKYLVFSTMILAAASFKILPLAFLCIYLLRWGKKEAAYFVSSLAAFAGFIALSYLAWPRECLRFLESAGGSDERGFLNPCSLAFIRDAFSFAGPLTANVVYAALATAAAALYVFSLRNTNEARKLHDIFFFAVTYALIAPRFKGYSYIMLIPAAYYILDKCFKGWVFIAGLLVCSANVLFFAHGLLGDYYYFHLIMILWALYFWDSIKAGGAPRPTWHQSEVSAAGA